MTQQTHSNASTKTQLRPQNAQETPANTVALTRQLGQMVDKRLNILRRIHETGSISEAARSANVSYKAAWQAIETLSTLAGAPLVEKAVGGTHGGGTRLTATGVMALELSERLARAREDVLQEFVNARTQEIIPIGSSTLRTSMRNQIPVTITHISRGPAMVRVTLTIDEENALKASLTQESAQLLGLKPDLRVLALTKATAIDIEPVDAPESLSNGKVSALQGTVIRSARQDKGGEVTLRLVGGSSIVGFVHAGHGLSLGDRARAIVPAQAVVVALFD